MSFSKLIHWQQGMMLKPHHLQYSNIAERTNQWNLIAATNIFPWGVIDKKMDQSLLLSGIVGISALECIFPDGTWVKVGENASVLNVPYEPQSVFPKSNYMIYAGIMRLDETRNNVTSVQNEVDSAVQTRFVSKGAGQPATNLYEQDVDVNMRSLEYVVQLFTDQTIQNAKDFIVMPIASLRKSNNGEVVENMDYVPPMPNIGSSRFIADLLHSLYNDLKRIINQLDSYKMQSVGSSSAVSAEEIVAYMTPTLIKYSFALRTCSCYLSRIRHVMNTKRIHPWQVFGLLHELASELTSYTSRVSLLSIDVDDHILSTKYDHFDCADGLLQLRQLIGQLLSEVAVSDEMNVSAERKQGSGEFNALIPERFLNFKSRFYIAVVTKEDSREWLDSFQIYARIASATKLADIVNRSLPGLSVQYIESTPPGLPVRQNAHYFLVQQSGSVWESVFSSRTVAILWNEVPSDATIDISVVGA